MTTSNYMPDVKVEVAFDAGFSTPEGSRVWTDVSGFVELEEKIDISRGRSDELATVEPSSCKLTLDNKDGRFTADRTHPVFRTNLQTNPRAGTAITGWVGTVTGGTPVVTRVASGGPAESATFGRCTPNAAGAFTGVAVGAGVVGLATGSTYTFTPSYRYVSPVASSVTLYAFYYTAALAFVSLESQVVGSRTNNTWYRDDSMTVTLPPTAEAVVFYVQATPDAGTYTNTTSIGATALLVEEGDTNGDYFDGSTVSSDDDGFPLTHAWTGTADASTSTEAFGFPIDIGQPLRVTSTPVDGSASVRFLGYIDEWPTEWDGTDKYAQASISATSRTARLGLGAGLGSSVINGLAGDGGIFPMDESAGATTAHDATGVNPSMVLAGSGAAPTFGKDAGYSTGVSFGFDGQFFRTDLVSPSFSVEFLVEVVTHATSPSPHVRLSTVGGGFDLLVNLSDAGVSARSSAGESPENLFGDPLSIGTHYLAGYVEPIDTRYGDFYLYIDGVKVDESLSFDFGAGNLTAGAARLLVGNGLQSSGTDGDVRFANVVPGADRSGAATRAAIAINGYAGNTAAEMIELYGVAGGIPLAEIDADPDTAAVDFIDTTDLTALDAMRIVETTEGGALFDGRDGTLRFLSRAARYNETSTITLDMAAQEVEAGVRPNLDRFGLANDVTVTASDGGSVVRVKDQASIDKYGVARKSFEIAADAEAALQAASWHIHLYSVPKPRVPALVVDLLPLSAARQADLLDLDVGSRLTVDNWPSQAATSTADYFAEGYHEVIGFESYAFEFNTSPTDDYDVWTVEDAVLGQYDAFPIAY